jgi:MurNAc alpha-1-phosphate uridylyltransferase
MKKIETAMVLAAGLGRRMRPLTDTLPKPLIEVAGRSLIDRVFDRLIEAGVTRIVVNLHHHRATLEAHLAKRHDATFVLSPESDLLETGGGVLNALPLLGAEPFYCVNADVLWFDGATPALTRLADAWFAQGFVHAQDRLFQMELNRRRALGRSAEWLGAAAFTSGCWARPR